MSRKKNVNTSDFVSRLSELMALLDYGGRQQVKFAKIIGVSPSFLSDVMNQKSGPSVDLIAGITITFPQANIRWLLTGEGSPLREASEIVIDAQVSVIPSGKNGVSLSNGDVAEYLAVPLVEGRIAAGPGRIVREDIRSFVWVYRPELGKRIDLIAVQIGGQENSMQPTLPPGSIVIIDKNDRDIVKTGIYAVRLNNDECAIKRVHILDGLILFCSDNQDYPPALASSGDLGHLVIGRVIWSWKSLL